jgi:hypothetical protein
MEPVLYTTPKAMLEKMYYVMLEAEARLKVAPAALEDCLNWLEDERGFTPPVRNGWITSKADDTPKTDNT